MDEVVEDLTEKARYRPGKRGRRKGRPRQPHEPESIFYSRRDAMADIAQRTRDEAMAIIRPESAWWTRECR